MSLGNRRMREIYDTFISYAHEIGLTGSAETLFNLIEEMRHECE
jgi:hypothetical protein